MTKVEEVIEHMAVLRHKMQTCDYLTNTHYPASIDNMLRDIEGGIIRRAREAQKVREGKVAKFIEDFAEDESEAESLTRTLRDYL